MSMLAPTHRPIGLALALSLAAPLACSKSDESTSEAEAKPDPSKADAAEVKADEAKADAPTPEPTAGLGKAVADEIAAAATNGRLGRGSGLGHVLMPNPSRFLSEVRTKVAPAEQAGFLDEAALRGLVGMALGPRGALANKVALDQPMGCMVVDDISVDVPVACIVGYEGGAEAAATDLGSEGKQADAEGHVAHYRVDGNDLYLDTMGEHVVITTGPKVYRLAKGYLETNLVGRAGSVGDDIEMVVFPKAAMARYSDQIESVMSIARGAASAAPPTGNPVLDAIQSYSRSSVDRGLDAYRETDQFEFGLSLEEVGGVFRWAVYPTEGTGTQADVEAISAGPIDAALVSSLPAEAWLVVAYTLDWKAAWNMESAATVRNAVLDVYAAAVGRSPTDVSAAVEGFLADNASIYGKDMAMAVMHLPGTQGGLVVSRSLAAPGRESWKTWSEGFGADAILGPEGNRYVTWSFTPDALEVEGVAVDRWTIEPGPEAAKEIAAKKDPVIAEVERRFGGLKLTIDRVELDDRAVFVVAPGAQESYVRAVITAAKGGPGVGADAGLTAVMARNPDASALMAMDVAGALTWVREVFPPEITRSLPAALGSDLSDYSFAVSYGAKGSQRGEMVISQRMLDQLRGL